MTDSEKGQYRSLVCARWVWIAAGFVTGLTGFGVMPLLPSVWRRVVGTFSAELIFACIVIAYFCWARDKKPDAQSGSESTTDEVETLHDVRLTTTAVLTFVIFGLLALICFASSVASPLVSWRQFAKVVGAGGLYAGAFFAAGALAGFLFGIPRTVPRRDSGRSGDTPHSPGSPLSVGTGAKDTNPSQTSDGRRADSPYATNTNLEDISDWLTKIIVGLGLINLKTFPDRLKALSWYFAQVCRTELCDSVALALMMHFFIAGFFLSYLMTRLFLTGAFTRADRPPAVKAPKDLEVKGIPVEVKGTGDLAIIQDDVPGKSSDSPPG